jgi:hypothetical protein
VDIKPSTVVTSGRICLRLVNGNEVWSNVDIQAKFITPIRGDVLLFSLPYVSFLILCKLTTHNPPPECRFL